MSEELQADNLKEIIDANEQVIVQYGASWCGVCKVIRPKFNALAAEYTGVKFLYVDAEKFPGSRELAKVDNLPTFAGFKNGELVKQGMGSQEATIKGILDAITGN